MKLFRITCRLLVLLLVPALSLIMAAPAGAEQAKHIRVDIHDSFPSEFWTDACGTDVVITQDGVLNVTLVYNHQGLLVKEIDPSGGGTLTFSAPLTGDSFSFPIQSTIIDYGAGAQIGSTFTMKLVGLSGHVPGYIASDAGQIIVTGVVFGFEENGSPLLEFHDIVLEHGNSESGEAVAAAVCSALTA
jgi:hypothetical protein